MTKVTETSTDVERRFLTRYPPSQRPFDWALIRQWIGEAEAAIPGFRSRLRVACLEILREDDRTLVRQALQCFATVGVAEDLALLRGLLQHPDETIARDAKTCLFEIEHRAPDEVDT